MRLSDPQDARLKRLRLTAEGRDLVTRASAIARAVDAELFTVDLREELRAVAARAHAQVE